MDPAPENFEKLQKLLALKRHEQPPPGFFARFPSQVRARIEGPHREQPTSWWHRLAESLDARPMLAGAYGLAVGGILLLGVNLLVKPEPAPGFANQPQAGKEAVPPLTLSNAGILLASTNLPPPPSNGSPPGFLVNPGTGDDRTQRQMMPASLTNR